jgi:hypothetical protein
MVNEVEIAGLARWAQAAPRYAAIEHMRRFLAVSPNLRQVLSSSRTGSQYSEDIFHHIE